MGKTTPDGLILQAHLFSYMSERSTPFFYNYRQRPRDWVHFYIHIVTS